MYVFREKASSLAATKPYSKNKMFKVLAKRMLSPITLPHVLLEKQKNTITVCNKQLKTHSQGEPAVKVKLFP